MIITKTPIRISFAGGGTDIATFYRQHPGAVVSTTINKYIYITIAKKFDDKIMVTYSKTEIVDDVEQLEHLRAKAAMQLTGITKGITITTMADIPSKGTGLGSSSAFTVGLLNALHAYKGEICSAAQLAEEACKVEIDMIKEPIGKQDQYIAAKGGFRFIDFLSNEMVMSDIILIDEKVKKKLEDNMMMFYTGITRSASDILIEQGKRADKNFNDLLKMKGLAIEMRNQLLRKNIDSFGELLHEGWMLKQKLASDITNKNINMWYDLARKAGAIGGKICGGGGGGFLLLYCHPENQDKVRLTLPLKEMKFKFEPQGSKIIYVGD